MRSAEYNQLANDRERQAAEADSPEVREMLLKIAASYRSLAETEDWLAGADSPQLQSMNGQGSQRGGNESA
jgi:hypothetical protein